MDVVDNMSYYFTQREIYQMGWWATLFEAPSPTYSDPLVRKMGYVYGGDADNPVPYLDLKNLNHTHDGKTGYDEDSSDELGPLSGFHLLFNFDITIGGNRLPGATGNQKFRFHLRDDLDNLWYQDVELRFLGDTQQFIIPFSGFKIYRARNPIRQPNLSLIHI